jgi:hypothetical protein
MGSRSTHPALAGHPRSGPRDRRSHPHSSKRSSWVQPAGRSGRVCSVNHARVIRSYPLLRVRLPPLCSCLSLRLEFGATTTLGKSLPCSPLGHRPGVVCVSILTFHYCVCFAETSFSPLRAAGWCDTRPQTHSGLAKTHLRPWNAHHALLELFGRRKSGVRG